MRKRRKKHANEIIIKVKSPGQMWWNLFLFHQ
jgi:hypothetical protein